MRPVLFCSLQSVFAKQKLEKYNYNFQQLSTLVLMIDDTIFYRSDAAMWLAKFLKPPYSWLYAFKIIPKLLRDAVYDFIAKNRKKLVKETFCYMPSPQHKNRFIE